MNSKGNKHLGPVGDERERQRRMRENNTDRQVQNQGDLSTPSLPLSDRELDIRVPAPNAPMDDDLRPRTSQPDSRD